LPAVFSSSASGKSDERDRLPVENKGFAVLYCLNRLFLALATLSTFVEGRTKSCSETLTRFPRNVARVTGTTIRNVVPVSIRVSTVYRAVQFLDLLPDNGKSESSAGDVGDHGTCLSRLNEKRAEGLPPLQVICSVLRYHRMTHGERFYFRYVDLPAPSSETTISILPSLEETTIFIFHTQLSYFLPLLRHFNAVVDTISHQMHERVFHLLQHPPVYFDLAAFRSQFDFFTLRTRRSRTNLGNISSIDKKGSINVS